MFKTFVTFVAYLQTSAMPAAPQRVAQVEARLTADAVVARVQSFYDKNDRLSAKFRQYYTNATFGKKTKSDGKVYIKKPGKMRWDYIVKKATEKSFISDGSTMWAVQHDNKQVAVLDLEQELLPVAVTFLYGKGDLGRDFDAKLDPGVYGAKGDYVVKLTPKKPTAQYKHLWLVVAPDNFRVKESIVLEDSGNTNHFKFFSPSWTKEIKDEWFVFNLDKVKGYRLIDKTPPANP
jgi:outer membrane lipoprotein carrier protein